MNNPLLSQMRQYRSVSTGVTSTILRVLVDVSKGKLILNYMQFLLELTLKVRKPKKNSGNTKLKPRSQQNTRMKLPFRVLALRENEFNRLMMKDLLNYYNHFYG